MVHKSKSFLYSLTVQMSNVVQLASASMV